MKSTFITRLTVVLLLSAATLPAQTYKVLYNFGSHAGDPSNPRYSGAISQGRHGYLYTSADDYWTDAIGSAFSLTTNGQLTVLHRFNIVDGEAPVGGVSLGADGYYYGTTTFGGGAGFGTVFNMRADNGGVGTLYSFSGGDDGAYPNAAPVRSIGGDFFGTTVGTSNTHGSIYKVSASGVFTLMHVFTGSDGSGSTRVTMEPGGKPLTAIFTELRLRAVPMATGPFSALAAGVISPCSTILTSITELTPTLRWCRGQMATSMA